jgi:hypothetical protein
VFFNWNYKPKVLRNSCRRMGDMAKLNTCTELTETQRPRREWLRANRQMSVFVLCVLSASVCSVLSPRDFAFGITFTPDPASIQREGPAYRYPQEGWIVCHVEGEPYDRGYQQGKLLALEIAGYVRCFAATQSFKSPADGWKLTRTLVNSTFLHSYDPEILEEMRGIADGAAAGGGKFDGRPIDLTDIVAINAWAELMSLDDANGATATGLEGKPFSGSSTAHCSAFVACAPATADGKIVIGHTSMFDLYPSLFFNVWLDVKPAKGHRISYQGFPGAINSGMDWYQTDAGLIVVETTIDQTKFDPRGEPEASRIRRAVQYADSIDDFVRILSAKNNGLYANEWLIADTKTNEIAMLDLGTSASKLWRSSKQEWFGNTPGFYWSCNNEKDLNVRLETIPSVHDRPSEMLFRPEERDGIWVNLYEQNKGHIDGGFARLAFSTPVLVSRTSVDAKYTTSDLQKDLKCEAIFGPPLGRGWEPTFDERKRFPEVYEMASNPWTELAVKMPLPAEPAVAAVDLDEKPEPAMKDDSDDSGGDEGPSNPPAWEGTLLSGGGGDAWLASAFAMYEPIVADEQAKLKQNNSGDLSPSQREELGIELFGYRTGYIAAARATADTPLASIQMDVADRSWYRIARGKGVLLLQELRRRLGLPAFVNLMQAYGSAHAGKPADAAAFEAMAEAAPYSVPAAFFDDWLRQSGLAEFELIDASSRTDASGNVVSGKLRVSNPEAVSSIDVTVETADDEKTQTVAITGKIVKFEVPTDKPAVRVVVNKYGATPMSNGGRYSMGWFNTQPQKALIIYGTQDEEAANREAAEKLQKAIANSGSNVMIPIKADVEAMDDEELKNHDLLLVGRPSCNRITFRMKKAFPVSFGERTFTVDRKLYASANSVLLAVGANPLNDRYTVSVMAGLSAEATVRHASALAGAGQGEVQVISNGDSKDLVIPPAELVHDIAAAATTEAPAGR